MVNRLRGWLLAPWRRFWEWATEHRDTAVSDALNPARPGPIDRDLDRLLRELGD